MRITICKHKNLSNKEHSTLILMYQAYKNAYRRKVFLNREKWDRFSKDDMIKGFEEFLININFQKEIINFYLEQFIKVLKNEHTKIINPTTERN